MDKESNDKKLEAISNGFIAASKIQQALNPINNDDSRMTVKRDSLDSINEIINIINLHSPGSYRNGAIDAAKKSMEYSKAYKDIKQYFNTRKNERLDNESFINTVKVMKPILTNQHKVIIDKFLKITEILYQ